MPHSHGHIGPATPCIWPDHKLEAIGPQVVALSAAALDYGAGAYDGSALHLQHSGKAQPIILFIAGFRATRRVAMNLSAPFCQ